MRYIIQLVHDRKSYYTAEDDGLRWSSKVHDAVKYKDLECAVEALDMLYEINSANDYIIKEYSVKPCVEDREVLTELSRTRKTELLLQRKLNQYLQEKVEEEQ